MFMNKLKNSFSKRDSNLGRSVKADSRLKELFVYEASVVGFLTMFVDCGFLILKFLVVP